MNRTSTSQSSSSGQINEIPDEFKNLFEISPELREKMKGKSLSLVYAESTLGCLQLTLQDRRLSFAFKRSSEQNMERVINKKIESYDQIVKTIFFGVSASMEILGIAGGFFGATCKGIGMAAQGGINQLENQHKGQETGFDYLSKTEDQMAEQNRQRLQSATQYYEKILEIFMKEQDRLQESIRSIVASAA